jgi:single-stranded DNA-binding protein
MTIDCAFYGFLAADAEQRTSQAGKQWTRMRMGVGQGETVKWLGVACFGKAAEAAAKLRKGDRCYVEGSIKLDSWRGNDGVERHELSVAAFKCERTHNIGRSRQRDDRDSPPGDAHGSAREAGSTHHAASATAAYPFDDPISF